MTTFDVIVLGEAKRGYATLEVGDDAVVLDLGGELLRHESRRVTMIRPRLDIADRRVTFVLQGQGRMAAVRAHGEPTAAIAAALERAGFDLDSRRTFADALPPRPQK